jgi:signal transduction histidine kinase
MGHFTVDETPGDRLVIEITARAHSEIKNGLGGIRIGPLPLIEAEHRNRLVSDVLLLAGLAVAAIFAGVIGLTIGDQRNANNRILVVVSWLSIVGGLRCLHNLVIDAPLPIVVWQRIGLWLLALAGLLTLQVVSTYLATDRPSRKPLLGGAAAITLLFTIPPSLIDSKIVINIIFAAIPLIALVLLAKLLWRLKTRSDAIGITILVIFAVTLAAGIHDYVMHLSSATLSGQYLQTWTLPATLAISVVALVKRASDQREIERQLQQATIRREELLRDLHDRIGSRLVALSFHARQVSEDPALVTEIQSLIHEVRLIHGAVAAEATSIDSLLADLRHLYSRIGGGRLPIHWELAELAVPLELDANQAIAVLRIVEEAVANIIKHAQAERITIRLTGPFDNDLAALEVIDNGAGEFRPGESGGLENMRLRAEQAGLNIELTRLDQGKAVRIRFPRLSATR